MATATKIKDVSVHFNGRAFLYKVDPPMKYGDGESETEFVVVSAAIAPFTGPETYIFPSDKEGKVVDWGELDGSFRGAWDHARALEGAGYQVI